MTDKPNEKERPVETAYVIKRQNAWTTALLVFFWLVGGIYLWGFDPALWGFGVGGIIIGLSLFAHFPGFFTSEE